MRTIIHLFPSRANLAGFLLESAWGLAGLVGFLPEGGEVLLGTVEEARKAGFLCVISLFSTLRSPFVMSAPRLSSANTAATPLPDPEAGAGGGPGAGGGGGGGAGGAPPVTDAALYSLRDMPLEEVSGLNTGFKEIEYLWIPTQSGGVVFHIVLPQFFQKTDKRANPLDMFRIPERGIR